MVKQTKQKLLQPTKEHAEELKASLAQYNDSFTTLLNLVPAKYYLTQDEDDVAGKASADLSRKQKRKLAQAAAEEKIQLSLAKRAAKKAKYDPTTPRTVTEIQAAREEAKKTKPTKAQREMEAVYLNGFDFDENSSRTNGAVKSAQSAAAEEGDDDEDDSENDIDFVGSDDEAAPAAAAIATAPSTSARPSIAELRANLTSRPPASSNGDIDSVVEVEGSSAGKEALLAERKRQSELREKRRKSTKARIRQEKEDGTSSFKGKQKESMSALPLAGTTPKPGKMSEIKKQLKKEGKRQFFNFDTEEGAPAAADQAAATPAAPVAAPQATESTSKAVVPQASTSSASIPSNSIAFSSLDFASSSALNEVDAPKLTKKQRENLGKNTKLGLTSHNPTVALAALNKRQEFLSKLTPDARERAEEKDKWERMAMRAEGTKVYDDEAKLKKMLKKKEKSKDKSRKDWADRKEHIQKTQEAAGKKREANIQARLQQKKDKKMGVKPSKSVGKANAKKKGRPGFEGKGGSKK